MDAPSRRLLRLPPAAASVLRWAFVVVLQLAAGAAARADSMVSFVHIATAGNISGYTTQVDHPLLDDHPDARVFVTQNWNPPGGSSVYNPHYFGVLYDVFMGDGRWKIYNSDLVAMPLGAAFNVVVAGPETETFLHLTHNDNINNRASFLDCDYGPIYICSQSGLRLIFSPVKNPVGISGGHFDHPASILYSSPSWAVVTENSPLEVMPAGVFFWLLAGANQFDALAQGRSFTHTANGANSSFNWTELDSPHLNLNPRAVFLISRNGPAEENHPHSLGVFYGGGRWNIFHEDGMSMILESRFHVFVPPIFADGFEAGDLSWWS